jgi:hypothetical protein
VTIKIHHLRPAPGAKTAKTRVGRGEGGRRGKTAGRGTKGTKARKNVPAAFEGGQMPLHMRLPKLSGFKNRNKVVRGRRSPLPGAPPARPDAQGWAVRVLVRAVPTHQRCPTSRCRRRPRRSPRRS